MPKKHRNTSKKTLEKLFSRFYNNSTSNKSGAVDPSKYQQNAEELAKYDDKNNRSNAGITVSETERRSLAPLGEGVEVQRRGPEFEKQQLQEQQNYRQGIISADPGAEQAFRTGVEPFILGTTKNIGDPDVRGAMQNTVINNTEARDVGLDSLVRDTVGKGGVITGLQNIGRTSNTADVSARQNEREVLRDKALGQDVARENREDVDSLREQQDVNSFNKQVRVDGKSQNPANTEQNGGQYGQLDSQTTQQIKEMLEAQKNNPENLQNLQNQMAQGNQVVGMIDLNYDGKTQAKPDVTLDDLKKGASNQGEAEKQEQEKQIQQAKQEDIESQNEENEQEDQNQQAGERKQLQAVDEQERAQKEAENQQARKQNEAQDKLAENDKQVQDNLAQKQKSVDDKLAAKEQEAQDKQNQKLGKNQGQQQGLLPVGDEEDEEGQEGDGEEEQGELGDVDGEQEDGESGDGENQDDKDDKDDKENKEDDDDKDDKDDKEKGEDKDDKDDEDKDDDKDKDKKDGSKEDEGKNSQEGDKNKKGGGGDGQDSASGKDGADKDGSDGTNNNLDKDGLNDKLKNKVDPNKQGQGAQTAGKTAGPDGPGKPGDASDIGANRGRGQKFGDSQAGKNNNFLNRGKTSGGPKNPSKLGSRPNSIPSGLPKSAPKLGSKLPNLANAGGNLAKGAGNAGKLASNAAQGAVKAGQLVVNLAGAALNATLAALGAVATAVGTALAPFIAGLVFIALLIILAFGVLYYVYCDKNRPDFLYFTIDGTVRVAETAASVVTGNVGNVLKGAGGQVVKVVDGKQGRTETQKFFEDTLGCKKDELGAGAAGVCPAGTSAYAKGADGKYTKVEGPAGDGSKDTGTGAGNIACLAAPRSGLLADPYVRALARAISQSESGTSGLYKANNQFNCYGRYQWCYFSLNNPNNGGAWGETSFLKNQGIKPQQATDEQQDIGFAESFDIIYRRNIGGDYKSLLRSAESTNSDQPLRTLANNMCTTFEVLCSNSFQSTVIADYKKVLPEEKAGSCGTGTTQTPKTAVLDKMDENSKKLAQKQNQIEVFGYSVLNLGSVKVNAQENNDLAVGLDGEQVINQNQYREQDSQTNNLQNKTQNQTEIQTQTQTENVERRGVKNNGNAENSQSSQKSSQTEIGQDTGDYSTPADLQVLQPRPTTPATTPTTPTTGGTTTPATDTTGGLLGGSGADLSGETPSNSSGLLCCPEGFDPNTAVKPETNPSLPATGTTQTPKVAGVNENESEQPNQPELRGVKTSNDLSLVQTSSSSPATSSTPANPGDADSPLPGTCFLAGNGSGSNGDGGPDVVGEGGFIAPTTGIGSPAGFFGASRDGGARSHAGLDIFNAKGTPIKASKSGTVVTAVDSGLDAGIDSNGGAGAGGCAGNFVTINHNNGQSTRYLHMQPGLRVKQGDTVKQGQVIGTMSMTGCGVGFHLHFEIIEGGGAVNPCKYFQAQCNGNGANAKF